MDSFFVATFHSVTQALRFEKTLQEQNLDVQMIPVPRVISASCGIAARLAANQLKVVESLLSQGKAEVEAIYSFSYAGNKVQAERVRL